MARTKFNFLILKKKNDIIKCIKRILGVNDIDIDSKSDKIRNIRYAISIFNEAIEELETTILQLEKE